MISATKQLGLVTGAPLRATDNARRLMDAAKAGDLTETVEFSAGVYYHACHDLRGHESLAFTGQGQTRWRRRGAFDAKSERANRAAAVLVCSEPVGWRFDGDGISLCGLNLWGGFYGDARHGTGIEWRDWGRRDIRNCSFSGWDIDWLLANSNHNDTTTLTNVTLGGRVNIRGEENQAASIDGRGIWLDTPGEAFIDTRGQKNGGGGNWKFDTLFMGRPRTLLVGQGGGNTCTYIFENVKFDNNAGIRKPGTLSKEDPGQESGWRIADWTGPLNLKLHGHIGLQSVWDKKPLVAHESSTHDIALNNYGKILAAEAYR